MNYKFKSFDFTNNYRFNLFAYTNYTTFTKGYNLFSSTALFTNYIRLEFQLLI